MGMRWSGTDSDSVCFSCISEQNICTFILNLLLFYPPKSPNITDVSVTSPLSCDVVQEPLRVFRVFCFPVVFVSASLPQPCSPALLKRELTCHRSVSSAFTLIIPTLFHQRRRLQGDFTSKRARSSFLNRLGLFKTLNLVSA